VSDLLLTEIIEYNLLTSRSTIENTFKMIFQRLEMQLTGEAPV
jgi:hypothetical protein